MMFRRGFDAGLVVLAIAMVNVFGPRRTARAEPACTAVGGLICQDTTWTADASSFCVTNSIIIGCGATLTIEAGAVVCFPRGLFGITVGSATLGEGTLVARGTPDAPITFTSCEPDAQPGDWVSINFTDAAVDTAFDVDGNYLSGSILGHVVVEYAGADNASGAVMASMSSPLIALSIIRNNMASGIFATGNAMTPPIRIEGNTITSNNNGGIAISSSDSATLTGNTIIDNTGAPHSGGVGGITISSSDSATLTGNTITGNTTCGEGGGINIIFSDSVTLLDNTIIGNTSSCLSGGGVSIFRSNSTTLIGNTITDNATTLGQGGGVSICGGDSVTLTGNTITNNTATRGGGVSIRVSDSTTLIGNTFTGNYGGGVDISSSGTGTLTDNTIIDNPGGGVGIRSSGPVTLTGDVILRNSPNGGLTISHTPDVVVRDCVLANNTAHLEGTGGGIHAEDSPGLTLTGAVVLLGNSGFDLADDNFFGPINHNIPAKGVWWGTLSVDNIAERIWDFSDDADRGMVDFDPPAQTGTFDFNGNGEILLNDLPGFVDCLIGPAQTVGVSCRIGDLDRDADVDLFDFAVFQTIVRP